MSKLQSLHIKSLQTTFNTLLKEKYEAGALEHGGNIWDMDNLNLLYNLRDEIIDAYVYLQTAIEKLEGKPKPTKLTNLERISFKGFGEFPEDKIFIIECDITGGITLREAEE